MKETGLLLLALIVVVALSVTAYKKHLNKDASRKGIIWLAVALSVILTTSLAFGIQFVGMPWALPAYIISVFFLQWLVSQKVMDWGWGIIKGWVEKKVQSKI